MTQILVPDLGDFHDVEVIDVLVKAGDTVAVETPLVTLETDKATMDVPSSAAGVVQALAVKKGDRVSKGSVVLTLADTSVAEDSSKSATSDSRLATSPNPKESDPANRQSPIASRPEAPAPASHPSPVASRSDEPPGASYDYELVVLGAGPGGYTAAFRAADLGMKVAMIERWPTLGGVCLNVGCIPSKALLHAAKVIEEAESMSPLGIQFGHPVIDTGKLRDWKNKVVGRLTNGLSTMAKQRKVDVIHGVGRFVGPHELSVATGDAAISDSRLATGPSPNESDPASRQSPVASRSDASAPANRTISFRHCVIAAGSESVKLPGVPDDPRIIDSTGALELNLPKRMLVIGGGIIGLEMATVYDALGVKVSVVELTEGLMPGCDRDLVRPLEKRIAKRYEKIMVKTKVTRVEALAEGIRVTFEGEQAIPPELYDKVLVSVGRSPNGKRIDADKAGVVVNERGFIPVDKQMRTNVPHIFAIGDIVGQPMLAHKATHEGKVAVEVAHGEKRAFDARVIPSVAYTDPEVAWVGLTETEAKANGVPYEKAQFPWAASGRSLALNRDDGFTKLLFDPATHRVLGGGVVGTNGGDLISEIALAIEMGCDAADIGNTIHPHPTLSETVAFSAEAFEGTLTDLYLPKKR